ncbi:PVC-type heme-binding CxxCH protein [Lunatibacter salilacus]|uniref:PVC-type heme-binding CxxCH protein n=1 Tax=Lunatibacter salilacus TaxID=2483804 RepID=UPI001F30A260|nr:PVC-type heme-binding CxxCH protein [Lunatibacter salilacus]
MIVSQIYQRLQLYRIIAKSTNLVIAALLLVAMGCQNQSPTQERTLENALSTFELEEGFQIELIAGEPLIADPVDMVIDEHGRLYVVEMHGYPLDVSGSGKIKLLSDTNNDGIMDKSVLFADSLIMPTGIMRWKNGVIVTDPPHVYYLEDIDGDGRADKKEILLTGFALSNPQHNVNSPKLGLDNWIYIGHEPAVTTTIYEDMFGDRGSEVHFPQNPNGVRLPQNAGGRSIRFKPATFELELLGSRTQFGHTEDRWGHRFLVNNSNHVIQDVISATYLDRNPYLVVTEVTQSVSDHGSAAEVFPITVDPQHQLLTDLGVMTSACGLTAYLGAGFPSTFDNALFVAEPVSNIVHVDFLSDKGTGFVASRQHAEKEFLASTDSWFRPVNMYVGPDGALYILDYYRQIIEHPEWMAEDVVNSGALYNGTDQGRIYRVTPTGSKTLEWSDKLDLGDSSDEALVGFLAHENSWWRRNAQRLIVDRKSQTLKEPLVRMAQNMESPMGRLHALWTLQGMDMLEDDLILKALKDPEAGIRENAVKLAELHLHTSPGLAEALLESSKDTNAKVRFQLLCTLGFLDDERAARVRKDLLFQDIEDHWVQVAALSAPFEQSRNLLDGVLANFNQEIPAYGQLVQKLGAMIGASQQSDAITSLVKSATKAGSEKDFHWQVPLLRGLALGLRSKKVTVKDAVTENLLVESCFNHSSIAVRQGSLQILQVTGLSDNARNKEALKKAKGLAETTSLSPEQRSLGVDFMALKETEPHKDLLVALIDSKEPMPVQLSAFKAIGKMDDETVSQIVLKKWSNFTPGVRDEAISALMQNPERTKVLLDAINDGLIQPSNIGWRRSVSLMANKEESLRVYARQLLTRKEGESEAMISDYQAALELKGSMEDGKIVFQANCAICHKMGEDLGLAFGPDLSSLKNRRPANILTDIIDPNRSIADGYDLWVVELHNGDVQQGLIGSETPAAITLINSGGIEQSISRTDIKSLKVLDMSAMPSGLEQNISHQEMADLLAYIRKVE